jgi:DnaJ-class molecular chaperone
MSIRSNFSTIAANAKTLLDVKTNIRKRFVELSSTTHPDVAKNNPAALRRFKDVTKAYDALNDANREERKTMARDLVFGQQTKMWTVEMREIGNTVTNILAPVFALELPITFDSEPCLHCGGTGNVLRNELKDFFPIPMVCSGCNGSGSIPKCIADLKNALQSISLKKQ